MMEPSLEGLHARLERLERQVAWWRRVGVAALAGLGLVGAVAATVTTNPDEVKTRRLVITDGEGRGRAILTVDESDRTRLSLADRDGATTADLTVTPGQSAALSVSRAGARPSSRPRAIPDSCSVAARGSGDGSSQPRPGRAWRFGERSGQAPGHGRDQPDPEPKPSAFRSRGQRRLEGAVDEIRRPRGRFLRFRRTPDLSYYQPLSFTFPWHRSCSISAAWGISPKTRMSKTSINPEVALAGQRVRRKVIFALTLCSVIPLLLLTYAFHAPVREFLGPLVGLADSVSIPALLTFTALLMAGGAFIVWDIATALSRAAQLSNEQSPELPVEPSRKDEIGTLMSSFARMLATIEQQSQEINEFPAGWTSSSARPSATP